MPDCIEGVGSSSSKGYRLATIYTGRKNYLVRQHRMAYELAHGPIPDGLMVLHRCDNPACVNIEHLFLGTPLSNMRDKVTKGRHHNQLKTHCPNGHEYTPENTYVYTNPPNRMCKTCVKRRSIEARRA